MQTRLFATPLRTWLISAFALVPVVAVFYGVVDRHLLDGAIATQGNVMWKLGLACIGMQLAFWGVFRCRQGLSSLALGAVTFWLLAFVYYAGPQAAFSALVMACVALALVSFLPHAEESPVALRLLLGIAVLVGTLGWLLPFPIHDARIYLPLSVLLLFVRRRCLLGAAAEVRTGWERLAGEQPWALAATTFLVGFASLGLWLPSVNYDDQSAHLILQNQLLRDGYYHLDIFSQAWAVSPWFNNAFHGLSSVLAGEPSRAPANVLWLLIGLSGAYRLARVLGASTGGALMATAIYASHPLTSYFGTTMQVDGVVAAVMMHLCAHLAAEHGRFRDGWKAGAMIGALLALKITNVVYLFGPCVYIAWMALRHRQWRWFGAVVITSVLVGGANYAYAWLITGNPVFPMLNSYFQSPYFPSVEFSDPRWHSGIHWDTLWKLTFETSRYVESWPGAAGVAMPALIGGVLVALARPGAARWITGWVLVAGLILFAQVQYLRYIFPAMAICCVAAIAALETTTGRRGALAVLTLVICIVNFLLMPTTYWVMYNGAWAGLVDNGRDYKSVILREVVPQEVLLAALKERSPTACVLLADARSPFIGTFPGNTLSVAWYDPQLKKAWDWANEDRSGMRWKQTLESLGVSRVMLTSETNPALDVALRQLGATVEDRRSNLELWSIEGAEHAACNRLFVDSRDRAHRLLHPWDAH